MLISISKDEDLKKWKDAIQKEKTFDWLNISTFQNNNKIEDKYFVTGIPHKILIDRKGLIIGKWKGSGSKNKRELKATIDKFL